jgi:hypothetical protein
VSVKKKGKVAASRKAEAVKQPNRVAPKGKTLKVDAKPKPKAKAPAAPAKPATTTTKKPPAKPDKSHPPAKPQPKIVSSPTAPKSNPKISPAPQTAKNTVTAKKNPAAKPSATASDAAAAGVEEALKKVLAEALLPPTMEKPATRQVKTTVDDMALDIEEKDELLEEEKKDLVKALREDEDEPLETAFVPTDTSERYILVVDEEGQRRTETLTIVQQILPNAVVEVADDPEEALEIMQDVEFDTYVVNFLMPGYSASPFVKAVANHPDHPLLIGFAADKISDALDQKKGLKIIPLKRLFDLDVSGDGKDKADKED